MLRVYTGNLPGAGVKTCVQFFTGKKYNKDSFKEISGVSRNLFWVGLYELAIVIELTIIL